MLKGELRKFVRLPSLWVTGGLIVLVVVLFGIGAAATVRSGVWPASLLGYRGAVLDALVAYTLVPVALAGTIIGSIVVGAEFAWGTWPLILTQGLPRHRVLAAKLLLAATLSAAAVLLVVLAGLGLAVFWRHPGRGAPVGSGAELLAGCTIAVIATMVWAFVAAAVTLLTRSTAAGLVGVGGYSVAEHVLDRSGALRPFLLSWNLRSLAVREMGPAATLTVTPTNWPYPPIWSTVLLLGCVLGVAVALVLGTSPSSGWARPRASTAAAGPGAGGPAGPGA
jgi:ABC-2 type transport system permease protein